jgi:hypothetical protein
MYADAETVIVGEGEREITEIAKGFEELTVGTFVSVLPWLWLIIYSPRIGYTRRPLNSRSPFKGWLMLPLVWGFPRM